MHKYRPCALAAALMLCLTGCAGTDTSDPVDEISFDFDDEDSSLPYGATMREKEIDDLTLTYDKRYISDEALPAIADYFRSIERIDTDLFAQIEIPAYMELVYEADYGGLFDAKAYLTQQHTAFAQGFSEETEDFSFLEIRLSAVYGRDSEEGSVPQFLTMLNELNQDETYAGTHVQEVYGITAAPTLIADGKPLQCADTPLYAVNIDGTWKICP